jgi:hypothetical protein
MLREGNDGKVTQRIWRCFFWCKRVIHNYEADLLLQETETDMDNSDTYHEPDALIFIFLVDCFIRSPRTSSGVDRWDTIPRNTIGICPIKMLFTMSSVIVSAASSVAKSPRKATIVTPSAPWTLFDIAMEGVKCIDNETIRKRWKREKLRYEFRMEFEDMLRKYTVCGGVVKGVVEGYIVRKWPEKVVDEDMDIVPRDGFQNDSWDDIESANVLETSIYDVDAFLAG